MRMGLIKGKKRTKGQGIVEFAIVLPILLLVVFGLIEFGRLLFFYTVVNNASREGARYGIAVGEVGGGSLRYFDCTGIRDAGLSIGRFAGMQSSDIFISYDGGPGTSTKYATCEILAAYGGGDTIKFGDRIVVYTGITYTPLLTYLGLNITPFTMSSSSHRTIVKEAWIVPAAGAPPPSTATTAPTMTSTIDPFITPTITLTPTNTVVMPTPTITNTSPPPPDAPINPWKTWDKHGNRCENIVLYWEPNPAWTTNPGSSPINYQVSIGGIGQGTVPALDPNPSTWVTGVTLSNEGTITYGVRALFSGMVGSDTLILNVSFSCKDGILEIN